MLAIDWLGCLATSGALLLLFRGKLRVARALAAVVLGEAGRAITALIVQGPVHSVTVGGLFSGLNSSASAGQTLSIAGLWVAAFLAIPLGPRLCQDLFIYALLGSGAILVLG